MQKIYIFGSQMRYNKIRKFVGEPQDHYQSTLNFCTLLLICKGTFPSLLEMKVKKNFLTIHPTPHPNFLRIFLNCISITLQKDWVEHYQLDLLHLCNHLGSLQLNYCIGRVIALFEDVQKLQRRLIGLVSMLLCRSEQKITIINLFTH